MRNDAMNTIQDIFDEIEAEDKDLELFDDDSAEDEALKQKLVTIEKQLADKERKRTEINKKVSSEFRTMLNNRLSSMKEEIGSMLDERVSKIKVEHPIRERVIEKQVVKNIQVPVEVSKIVKEVIKPQIIRETKVEVKVDEEDKKTIADLKSEVESLRKQIDEANRFMKFHAIGGSGVIGIPAPEGNPEGYVLAVKEQKAKWQQNTATSGGIPAGTFTISNNTPSYSFNATGDTVDNLYQIVATLIRKLQGEI